jgi:transposase-like protein
MLERLNQELKRPGTQKAHHVVRIFPDAESCLRLVRALPSRCTKTGSKRPDTSTWSI